MKLGAMSHIHIMYFVIQRRRNMKYVKQSIHIKVTREPEDVQFS